MRKSALVGLVVLVMGVFVTVSPLVVSGQTGEEDAANWVSIRVQTETGEDVEIALPLSLQKLIKEVVDFERLSELTEGKSKVPVTIMTSILGELRAAPPQEIVTVESAGTNVKIATEARKQPADVKPATSLKISVKVQDGKGDNVNICVPLGILELVARCVKAAPVSDEDFKAMGAGPEETGIRLAALVNELPEVLVSIRNMGPVDLVSVKQNKEEVRIWTE